MYEAVRPTATHPLFHEEGKVFNRIVVDTVESYTIFFLANSCKFRNHENFKFSFSCSLILEPHVM